MTNPTPSLAPGLDLEAILEAAKGFERGFYLFGPVTSGQLQDTLSEAIRLRSPSPGAGAADLKREIEALEYVLKANAGKVFIEFNPSTMERYLNRMRQLAALSSLPAPTQRRCKAMSDVDNLDIVKAKMEIDVLCNCPDCNDKRWMVAEIERLRAAQGKEVERGPLGGLGEPAALEKEGGPVWSCLGCGNTDGAKFRTIEHRGDPAEPVDYDLECTECGSLDNRESPEEALRTVCLELDTVLAELETLKARGEAPEASEGSQDEISIHPSYPVAPLNLQIPAPKSEASPAEGARTSPGRECWVRFNPSGTMDADKGFRPGKEWVRMVEALVEGSQPPAPLAWSREKPTREGWYWLRLPGAAKQVEFIMRDHENEVSKWYVEGAEEWEPILDGREWAGPIPEPQGTQPEAPIESTRMLAAWKTLRASLDGSDEWPTGDAFQYKEFFLHGWIAKASEDGARNPDGSPFRGIPGKPMAAGTRPEAEGGGA